MSSLPVITEHQSWGRIGRRYPATDAIGGRFGLNRNTAEDSRALDYFLNSASRLGWGTPSLTEATQYELVRLSYDYWLMITLYRNHWISRYIVDIPAQDMVRAWPRLTSEVDPKDLSKIDKAIRLTNTKSKILKTLQWARLFGGAGALIVIDGHEKKLDEPLDLDDVELGSYRGLIPFDRWSGIYPSGEISVDINRPLGFNLPKMYQVQNSNGSAIFEVHPSRILRFIGPSVPQPEYQAQMYWGISCLEPVYEEIRKRDNMSWNILGLTYRANILGMKFPELAQMLSGAGMGIQGLTAFHGRMQAMNQLLSNQNMLLLPEKGGIESTQYAFSGIAEVMQQFQMDIAGAARIPMTKLFGRTATGLGQSNETDERFYEEMISMEQDDQMRPQLDMLYPVIAMSALGEVPDDLDLLFPSVRVLNNKEKADLAKAVGDNIIALYGAGIIDKPVALQEIKQSSDITEIGTNVTDEVIEQAQEEADQAKELGLNFAPGEQEETPPNGKKGGGQQSGLKAKRKITIEEHEAEETPDKKKSKVKKKTKASDSVYLSATHFAGLPIHVEFQAGERRRIHNSVGDVVYDRVLEHPYGYISDTVGQDGDEIDAVFGPEETAGFVYVIQMRDLGPDVEARSDEEKVMLGFPDQASAVAAFEAMYAPEWLESIEAIPAKDYTASVLESVTV